MKGSQTMPWLGEVFDVPDFITVTASTYTVRQADFGRTIICNSATAQVITLPLFGLGFNVSILQIGAGAVTVVAGTGATLSGSNTVSRYSPTTFTAYSSTAYGSDGSAAAIAGTTPVTTVGIQEFGDAYSKTAVLTLTDFVVGALAGAGAALAMGNIVYAYPAGEHLETSYYYSLSLKATGTAVAANTALGSVIGTGAVATLAGTATFMDRLTQQAVTTSSTGGTAVAKMTLPTAGVYTGIGLNAAASVKNVFLNSAGTWNANNTGNLTATGTIVLAYQRMAIG